MRKVALTLVIVAACSSNRARDPAADVAPSVNRIPVSVATEQALMIFQAEIADTPFERSKGLMFRESLGPKEGMLFLFPKEAPLSFWMRNTLISLDMIFIRSDRTILGIVQNATPKTDTSRSVPGLSQFVLELPGGTCARLGIKAGQIVKFMAPLPGD